LAARAALGRTPGLLVLPAGPHTSPAGLPGYVAYVDRFAGTLAGVRERLPYLRELGVADADQP
jgi:amylosucrase